ncbi:carbonic anhydrase 2-like [Ischnura elegans]|uniref:carbonic anhydrase 2-like n=1 Tax=Ischnura elegans TaxID=197161 RepID=UPI001ED8A24D|nr:carbonic anhydrase 2-like [Ischnura elegans]
MIGKLRTLALLVALVCVLETHGSENDVVSELPNEIFDEPGLPGAGNDGQVRADATNSSSSPDFGYRRNNGPDTWPETFPTSCAGRRQSPINIRLNRADSASSEERRRLRFNNYDVVPSQMSLRNVGSTVTLTANFTGNRKPSISGFLLRDKYLFAEIHFHWGKTSKEGSEHLVDGRSYPLEMHVVHFKKEYGTVTEAKKNRDGLAVIGYFFKLTRRDRNRLLQRLIRKFDDVQNPDCDPVSINPFALEDLAPPFCKKFISYRGSLTTPLCDQVVRWIVSLKPLRLTSSQLPPFRKLKDNDGKFLVRNFRPPQPLNRRRVILVH